jgi:hypothetical protein
VIFQEGWNKGCSGQAIAPLTKVEGMAARAWRVADVGSGQGKVAEARMGMA